MKNLKKRYESKELRILRRLNTRSNLSNEDVNYLSYLEKGFEGEKSFDKMTSTLSDDWYFVNDLLLECNKSEFQIDSIGTTGNSLHLFEVKNFEGDYYLDGDRWYKVPKIEIKNPYDQLKRAESMLRKLFFEHKINLMIEPHLVFVNPDFYLYHAPMNLPIIFPNQLKRYLKQLNMQPSNPNVNFIKPFEQLISLHKSESNYSQTPKYDYNHLKKGLTCVLCNAFLVDIKRGKVICHSCGFEEGISNAVLRSIDEFKLLFPNRKLTTVDVFDWCKIYKSKKGIWSILSENYQIHGHGKYSYFD